jgi:phosphate uptake regulator
VPESRPTFHHQLDEVQRDLLRLSARVTEAIERGTEALLALDLTEAQALIDSDDEIDALSLDIEERCFGERVKYMVTGWLPEHDGAARLPSRAARAESGVGGPAREGP